MSTSASESHSIKSPNSAQLSAMAASGPLLLSSEDTPGFEPYTKVKGGYQCTFKGCGKVMGKPSAMEKHFRTHTGEKPFGCPEPGCGIRFAEMGNMRRHMRIHSGERPFPCPHQGCPSQFFRRDHLHTHLKSRAHEGQAPVDINAFLQAYKDKHGITGESGFSPQMTGELEDSPRRSKRKGEDGDNESISSGDEENGGTGDTPMHDASNADGPSSGSWRRKKGRGFDPPDAAFTLPDAALPPKALSNTRALAELQNILTRSHPHLASASNKAIMAVTGKSTLDANGQLISVPSDADAESPDGSEVTPMSGVSTSDGDKLPAKPPHPTAPGEELISPDMFDTLLSVLKPQNVAHILSSSSTSLPTASNPTNISPEPSNNSPVSGPESGPTIFSSDSPVQNHDPSVLEPSSLQPNRAKHKAGRPRGRLTAKEAIKWQSAQLLASAGLSDLMFANGGGLMNLSLSSPQFQPLSNRPVVVAPSLPAPGPYSNHPMTFVQAPVTLPPASSPSSSSAAGSGHVMKTSLFKTSIQNEVLPPPVTQTFPSSHHLSQFQEQTLFNNHAALDLAHILGGQRHPAVTQHVQIQINQTFDINAVIQQQQTPAEEDAHSLLSLNRQAVTGSGSVQVNAEGIRLSPMGKRFLPHSEFSTPSHSASSVLDNHHHSSHLRNHHGSESNHFLPEQQPLLPFSLPPAPTTEQINSVFSSSILPTSSNPSNSNNNGDNHSNHGSTSTSTSNEQRSSMVIHPASSSNRDPSGEPITSSVPIPESQITMLRLSPSPNHSLTAAAVEILTQNVYEVGSNRADPSPGALAQMAPSRSPTSPNSDRPMLPQRSPVKSPIHEGGSSSSSHISLPEYVHSPTSAILSHPVTVSVPPLDRGTSETSLSIQTASAIQTIQAAVQRSPNLRPRGPDAVTPPPIQ